MMRKIKILVVDDSLVFRETLARELARVSQFEVVATASNPYMARDKILEFEPDVMTLDVEMPRMNGIEFLRRLIPQYPIPVVVVSAMGENILEALNAGAIDFVTKPASGGGFDVFVSELAVKIKIASSAQITAKTTDSGSISPAIKPRLAKGSNIIAIGASTGGTEAIEEVIKEFTPSMPGTVVVQHMPAGFTAMYAARLNNSCLVEVKEAKTGDLVIPGRVLIAPGDYHMRVKRVQHEYKVECFRGDKVNGHCPSVDVLFESVAREAGRNAIGVILTGMGYDGAKGLFSMLKNDARTIGQDEVSSVVYGMPKVAFDIGAVQKQVPLNKIPQLIFSMLA